jgi:uncharacterized protein (DUF1697 family)
MATWIALLRGINVLGHKVLPMKALTASLEREGLQTVRTYIQSGNVVFRYPRGTPDTLAERIGKVVLDRHGFQPQVLVLSDRELMRAAAGNPFPKAESSPKTLHLFFLATAPRTPDLQSLARLKTGSEAFELRGKVFYLHTPDGFAASKLGARVERCVGVDATARNWRTVSKLVEMARSAG